MVTNDAPYVRTNVSIRFRTNANIYLLANVRKAGSGMDQFDFNEGGAAEKWVYTTCVTR